MLICAQPDKPPSITFKNFCIDDGISVSWLSLILYMIKRAFTTLVKWKFWAVSDWSAGGVFCTTLWSVYVLFTTSFSQTIIQLPLAKLLFIDYPHLFLFNNGLSVTTLAYSLYGLYFTFWQCCMSHYERYIYFLLLYSQNCAVSCSKAPLGHH